MYNPVELVCRDDPLSDTYHFDMDGNEVIWSAVDNLPTEFAKEASQHFGDILSKFIGHLESAKDMKELPSHLRRACITHKGSLTSLYEYIPCMRKSSPIPFHGCGELSEDVPSSTAEKKKHTVLVSLTGHLFDKFLINEALDIIVAAGGSFHLVKCQVGQSTDDPSFSEVEVGMDDRAVLDQIIDSLTSLANKKGNQGSATSVMNEIVVHVGLVHDNGTENGVESRRKAAVFILGAGRVCRPAAELLASVTSISSCEWSRTSDQVESDEANEVKVIVASPFLKDAEEVIQGILNARAIQLDVSDVASLHKYVLEVDVVISLLPASCHSSVANACIELGKHLVTASYVDDSLLKLDEDAKSAGVTILGEMGLDPGIDHMMTMKMINEAHSRGGKVRSFTSYCGGLPSPAAANNPLGYKFSWNPAGALRAGRNPAMYRSDGKEIHVSGDKLYDSATKMKLPGFPAFALECLPNRDSLVYGKLSGIMDEASTILRGTLRSEGFSKIMGTMAKLGFYDEELHPILETPDKPTYEKFTIKLLGIQNETGIAEKDIAERISNRGACQDQEIVIQTARTIIFLGLLKGGFPGFRILREASGDSVVGKTVKGRATSAMALTVGVPAAVGALLLLANKIKKCGILRPTEPEVYNPALEMIQAYGIKLHDKIE